MPRLIIEADRTGYKLQLDPSGVSNYLAEGKRYEKKRSYESSLTL